MSSVKRNVQFFRNKTVIGNYTSHDIAIEGATQKFLQIAQDPGLLDGEIVLYRYTINNASEIHTIVGVVCEKEGNKYIEILGNYDIIKDEIKTYVDNTLYSLDASVSGTDGQITVHITQTDGLISSVNVESNIDVSRAIEELVATLNGTANVAEIDGNTLTIYKTVKENNGIISSDTNKITLTFANVAFTGAAEDVSVSSTKFRSTNVKAALEEIVDNLGDTYSEGTNVVIDTNNKINVPLGLSYNSTDKTICLTQGTNDNATVIDSIPATDFIKDGMLKKAELVETDADGNTGKFIKLTWNTDADPNEDGTTGDVVYIDVTEFIDTYVGDDYITVENYTIKHNEQNVNTDNTYKTTITGEIDEDGRTIHGSELIFTVPSLKVDKAGHIVELQNETIKMILPTPSTAVNVNISDENNNFTSTNVEGALAELAGAITTSVSGIKNFSSIQIVNGNAIAAVGNDDTLKIKGDDEIKLSNSAAELLINHATHTPETIETTDVTSELSQTATVISVPVYSFNEAGHMIKSGTQKYKLTVPESNVTTVDAGNGIALDDNAEEGSNNHNYKVSVKLNPETNDMLTVNENGLNLSNTWECGEYM